MHFHMNDAAIDVPPLARDERAMGLWHWFWAKIFGQRVPTSGERAHIDNLMLTYRPDLAGDQWKFTDAHRVYRIGALLIYDYGDTPMEVYTTPMPPRERYANANWELLRENKLRYWNPAALGE